MQSVLANAEAQLKQMQKAIEQKKIQPPINNQQSVAPVLAPTATPMSKPVAPTATLPNQITEPNKNLQPAKSMPYTTQEFLNPQSRVYTENPKWLKPGETPEQYKARTQPPVAASPTAPNPAAPTVTLPNQINKNLQPAQLTPQVSPQQVKTTQETLNQIGANLTKLEKVVVENKAQLTPQQLGKMQETLKGLEGTLKNMPQQANNQQSVAPVLAPTATPIPKLETAATSTAPTPIKTDKTVPALQAGVNNEQKMGEQPVNNEMLKKDIKRFGKLISQPLPQSPKETAGWAYNFTPGDKTLQKIHESGVESNNKALELMNKAKDAVKSGNSKDAELYLKQALSFKQLSNEQIGIAANQHVESLDKMYEAVKAGQQANFLIGDVIVTATHNPALKTGWEAFKTANELVVESAEQGSFLKGGVRVATEKLVEKGIETLVDKAIGPLPGVVGRPPEYIESFLKNPERVAEAVTKTGKGFLEGEMAKRITNELLDRPLIPQAQ